MVREFYFDSSTGKDRIYAAEWQPEGAPRAVLQLAHGVQEHIRRYDALAQYFAQRGFLVVGSDHLGHGRTAASPEDLGYFADRDGWDCMVRDMRTLTELAQRGCGALPFFLLGHSMGSFLTRSYLIRYQTGLTGALLSGTGQQGAATLAAGRALARFETARHGARFRSKRLANLCFGPYQRAFSPARTKVDWLSSDEAAVDAYLADPYTRFFPTAGLYADMFGGMAFNQNAENLRRMDKKLPVLFYAGDRDPVGANGKGVRAAYESFRRAGMEDVTLRLYENGRHEMHNEVNREAVLGDLLIWMESNM